MPNEFDIEAALAIVEANISKACALAGATRERVTLVAVSKRQSIDSMRRFSQAAKSRNLRVVFGENYVQEATAKRECFPRDKVSFHLIGNLQSNKAKKAVEQFDCIETIDSAKIAVALDKEAAKARRVLSVLVEVNVSNDPAKAGVMCGAQTRKLVEMIIRECKHLCFEGLMTVTAYYEDPQKARGDFAKLRRERDLLLQSPIVEDHFRSANLRFELSMGMSSDYEIAIEEGATIVRVGTAIFGAREAPKEALN